MDRRKKYRELHKKLGLCIDCSNPARPGVLRCRKCSIKMHEYDIKKRDRKAQRERYKKMGKCPRCGKPLDRDADNGFFYCVNCREHSYEIN